MRGMVMNPTTLEWLSTRLAVNILNPLTPETHTTHPLGQKTKETL